MYQDLKIEDIFRCIPQYCYAILHDYIILCNANNCPKTPEIGISPFLYKGKTHIIYQNVPYKSSILSATLLLA